ncbi:MAG: tetratricopeptide repeat protein [Acidobacteriota bacterium]
MLLSCVWLAGLPGDWLLDDFSLPEEGWPSLARPRPLTYLTYWLNLQSSGAAPWAYRLTNILLHAAAVQFCFGALRRIVGPERALVAAALFAVHPLQAESVLYVFSRPVVLMGLLLWVGLELWLRGKHGWTVLFYGLALAAKEEAVAFPLVLTLLHFSISRNGREWRWIGLMYGMATVAGAGLLWAAAREAGTGAGAGARVGVWEYLASQPLAMVFYAKQLAWPEFIGLRWPTQRLPLWGVLLWIVPLWGLWIGRKHFERAGAAFWIAAAWVSLLPTSSFLPLDDWAAGRRLYLAIALLAAALPVGGWKWKLAAVLGLAAVAWQWSAELYAKPVELWAATVRRQPGEQAAILQYARYLPPGEALALLERNPAPENAGHQTELGRLYLETARVPEALQAFGKALAIKPGVASHVYNRGVALRVLGQKEAAEADFRRALEIDPRHKLAREALATRER